MAVVNQLVVGVRRSVLVRVRQERQGKEEGRPCGVCSDDDDVTKKLYLGWSVQMVMYVCGWM